jgi:putative transposase
MQALPTELMKVIVNNEPLRRWGSKTGVLYVWGIHVDGRKVLLSLSITNSESYESCLDVLRDLIKRGLQTPVTIPTDGASGLIKAVEAIWLRSLRIRCWFHKMQNLERFSLGCQDLIW